MSVKGQSVSAGWREKGNDLYRTVQDGLAPTLKVPRLQETMNFYGRAIYTATDNEDKSSACKNMAMAAWKMAKAKIEVKAKSIDVKFYFRESLKHFSDAKEFGRRRDVDWHDSLATSCGGCWTDFRATMDDLESEQLVPELEKFLPFLVDDRVKASEYLEIANHYFHWALTCVGERNYQEALNLLAECGFPLNEAERCGHQDPHVRSECTVLREDIFTQQCITESIKARVIAEELLDYVVKEEEVLNIDLVWEIIDMLRQSAHLTRERDIELEAMALSDLGKIYDKVLKLKSRAKTCLMKAIELANTMMPRNFTGEGWYEFARSTLERYQQETVQNEEEKNRKAKEEVLKLLKEDLDTLSKNHEKMSSFAFLVFVYNTYTPKNPEHKMDDVSESSPPPDLKKAYLKAVIHYHPDKVKEEEHGAKWKVLSEEICKLLTSTYEVYKA